MQYAHIWQIRETADGKVCLRPPRPAARGPFVLAMGFLLCLRYTVSRLNTSRERRRPPRSTAVLHCCSRLTAPHCRTGHPRSQLELYTCGQKTKTYSRDDWTRFYDVTNDESALIKGFKLLGQITVEEARHGPWKVRIERPLSAGTDNDMHHLHFSSLEVYDQTGAKLQLAYTGNASEYVKRGMKNAQTPADVIDGNINTWNHSDYSDNAKYGSQDHWMEFEVPEASAYGTGTPTTIVLRNDKGNRSRTPGVKLALLDHKGMTVEAFTLTTDEVEQRFELTK